MAAINHFKPFRWPSWKHVGASSCIPTAWLKTTVLYFWNNLWTNNSSQILPWPSDLISTSVILYKLYTHSHKCPILLSEGQHQLNPSEPAYPGMSVRAKLSRSRVGHPLLSCMSASDSFMYISVMTTLGKDCKSFINKIGWVWSWQTRFAMLLLRNK